MDDETYAAAERAIAKLVDAFVALPPEESEALHAVAALEGEVEGFGMGYGGYASVSAHAAAGSAGDMFAVLIAYQSASRREARADVANAKSSGQMSSPTAIRRPRRFP